MRTARCMPGLYTIRLHKRNDMQGKSVRREHRSHAGQINGRPIRATNKKGNYLLVRWTGFERRGFIIAEDVRRLFFIQDRSRRNNSARPPWWQRCPAAAPAWTPANTYDVARARPSPGAGLYCDRPGPARLWREQQA